MEDAIVVLVTTANQDEARRIAHALLEKHLIACANLLPVQSLYRWEGAIQDDSEVMMILKSTSAVFKDQLVAAIQAEHSYDVPEIIAMPIVLGSADYLKWIADSVK